MKSAKRAHASEQGFTLVEIAIVLIIIGLLIGGILKGSEMIQNAQISATIQQVKAYESAVGIFRDIYDATPGDMTTAAARLSGCNIGCVPFASPTGAGNGMVGDPFWETTWLPQGVATLGNAATTSFTQETYLFWTHLVLANLIVGVTPRAIDSPTAYQWGETHPAAKIGGGFVVGNAGVAAGSAPGNSGGNCGNGNNNGNNGNCRGGVGSVVGIGALLVLLPSPTSSPSATTSGTQQLSPNVAGRIDRKIDDGSPYTGFVQAFGDTTCFANLLGDPGYNETVTTRDCGLIFSTGH